MDLVFRYQAPLISHNMTSKFRVERQAAGPTTVFFPVFSLNEFDRTLLRFTGVEVHGQPIDCVTACRAAGGPKSAAVAADSGSARLAGPSVLSNAAPATTFEIARMKTIVHVVGARPNYMKIAPLMAALEGAPGIRQLLVNTGQHYDEVMSTGFLKELGLPAPDRNLNVGSASHAVQTAKVMMGFETVVSRTSPTLLSWPAT